MTTQQFLAKQRVKYIWKTLKQNVHRDTTDTTAFIDEQVDDAMESFWEYEQTPRTL